MFVIEDELHHEQVGELQTWEGAVAELRRLAEIPWDQEPNRAPCTGWKACGRHYEIVEYDITQTPRSEICRIHALEISANAVTWFGPLD